MIVATVLAIAFQSGLTLSFPTGGEMAYRESWRVTETAGDSSLSASADRTVLFRVKETTRGRTRFEVTYQDFNVRGSDKGLNDDLRSWLEQPNRDQWVNDRGYVERKGDEIRGNRPFFGLVLPAPGRSIPDRWTAKLLPPIGTERSADFEFRLITGERDLPILVAAKDKFGPTKLDVAGRINVSTDGFVTQGDLTTTLEDTDDKTTTVVEYRFQRQ